MRKKRNWMGRAGTLVLALALVLGLAGCGGGEAGADTPAGPETPATGQDAPAPAPGGEIDYDAVLTLAVASGWTDLIPYNNSTGGQYSMLVLDQLYDMLVYVAADGTISPRAAKSWELSEDRTTATFHLDETATWHDGESVTAHDYVFTVEMVCDPACPANNKVQFDVLAGVDANGNLEPGAELGIKALDDYTLQLTFDTVVDLDVYLYSECNYYAIPSHLLEDVDPADYLTCALWNAPVGNGPCVFESTVAGTQLVTTSYENYHLGRPGFGKLIIEYMSTTNMVSALISGDVDMCYPTLSSDDVAVCAGYDHLVTYKAKTPSTPYMMVMSNVVYTDSRVRRAFDYALDRELLCATLGADRYEPMSTPVYAGAKFYNDAYAWSYDPDKAVELLKQCEADGTFDFGETVKLYTPAGDREKAATIVQQNLKDIGLTAEIVVTEAGAMFGGMVAGEIGIGFANFSIQPNPMYFTVMTSAAVPSYVMCTTDMWDDYWKRYVEAATPEEKARIMDDYQRDWVEEQPAIFFACGYDVTAFSARLGDDIYYDDLNSNAYNWPTWKLQATK